MLYNLMEICVVRKIKWHDNDLVGMFIGSPTPTRNPIASHGDVRLKRDLGSTKQDLEKSRQRRLEDYYLVLSKPLPLPKYTDDSFNIFDEAIFKFDLIHRGKSYEKKYFLNFPFSKLSAKKSSSDS